MCKVMKLFFRAAYVLIDPDHTAKLFIFLYNFGICLIDAPKNVALPVRNESPPNGLDLHV
jgi:hypothetical protein